MHIYLALLITLFSSQTLAEIYSWEDKEGVTHFSETKPKKILGEVTTTIVEHTPSAMIPSLQTTDENSELSTVEEVTMPDAEKNNEQSDQELVDTTEENLTKEEGLPTKNTTEITQLAEEKETETLNSIEQNTSQAIETTNAIFTSSEEKAQATTSEIQKEIP